MLAAEMNFPTQSRKYRRLETAHPRRAEGFGGRSQLIYEEPVISALGNELHARRAENFGGNIQPIHGELKISAVGAN